MYGIAVYLYDADEPPARTSVPRYGEHEARIVIATGAVLSGWLPRRALRLVNEWTEQHRDELRK